MEILCNRCHQSVEAESLYCRTCGLPQLLYTTEGNGAPTQPEPWNEAVKDASAVEWKPALKAAMLLAVPAGVLSSGLTPLGVLGLLWMSAAAAWAVTVYVRRQRPAWITMGAGARIGLVTGLMAGALAFAASGSKLFVERFVLHQASGIENEWKMVVDTNEQLSRQLEAMMGISDPAQEQAQRSLMLSPEGHAGYAAVNLAGSGFFLVLFAAAGGAVGARLLARSRRPEV